MPAPPMSLPQPELNQRVLAHLRKRIAARKANGYRDVNVAVLWLEQLVEIAERELK